MTPEEEAARVDEILRESEWTERWSGAHPRRGPRYDEAAGCWELPPSDDDVEYDVSEWVITVDRIRAIEARVRRHAWTIPVVDSFPCAPR